MAFTPGFSTTPAPSAPSAISLTIRGQVQNDTIATLEPSIGMYADEFYWSRAYGINSDMLDISSVQVLKGPQGTLFGRNTPGGALVITSNDPDFRGLSGRASFTYGRYNERIAEGVINVPIGEKLSIRGAIKINQRDGWAHGFRLVNSVTGLSITPAIPPMSS